MEIQTAVYLIEGGIDRTTEKQVWADLGAGNGLFTNALSTLLSDGLPDGTYTYGFDGASKFGFGSVGIAVKFLEGTGDIYEVESGSLVISNSGKKFEFNVTVEGGKTVTGVFNGSLEVDN